MKLADQSRQFFNIHYSFIHQMVFVYYYVLRPTLSLISKLKRLCLYYKQLSHLSEGVVTVTFASRLFKPFSLCSPALTSQYL